MRSDVLGERIGRLYPLVCRDSRRFQVTAIHCLSMALLSFEFGSFQPFDFVGSRSVQNRFSMNDLILKTRPAP
jgi:hypothetical protein